MRVVCSHCKKEKEFFVHIDIFDRLKFFNDKNTILNIKCAFDEFPNFHDWCVREKGDFAYSVPIVLANKKIANIEDKELSLRDRYEIKKQLYYERTNAIKEKENKYFKDWLKKTGFDNI